MAHHVIWQGLACWCLLVNWVNTKRHSEQGRPAALRPLRTNLRNKLKCRSLSVVMPAAITTYLAYSDSSLLTVSYFPQAVVRPVRQNATRRAILLSEGLSLPNMERCNRH